MFKFHGDFEFSASFLDDILCWNATRGVREIIFFWYFYGNSTDKHPIKTIYGNIIIFGDTQLSSLYCLIWNNVNIYLTNGKLRWSCSIIINCDLFYNFFIYLFIYLFICKIIKKFFVKTFTIFRLLRNYFSFMTQFEGCENVDLKTIKNESTMIYYF